jgi:hypothetical protein
LRHKFHVQFPRHHLSLSFRVETDMAHDGLAKQLGINELADSPPGRGGVVGDHGQIAFALTHDLVEEPLGRADRHEAPDHQARAVGDHGDRLIERDGSHDCLGLSGNSAMPHLCRRPEVRWQRANT